MNLEKDQGILDLLTKLDVSERGWTIADHWEADLCAVGIALADDPRRLVYVSTYDMEPGRYNYECEESNGLTPEDYSTTETGENVDFHTLLAVMQRHLR
jgi:hypothetical protein